MRKFSVILGVAALGMSVSAFASSVNGWYLGGQLGDASSNGKGTSVATQWTSFATGEVGTQGKNSSTLSARVYGGYQFNPYLALDFGVENYANTKIKLTDLDGNTATAEETVSALDVMAKGMLPVSEQVDLFAAAGLAIVTETSNEYTTGVQGFVRPKLAFGVDYEFASHWSMNVSYSRIFGTGSVHDLDTDNGKVKHYLPDLSMAAVGVQYTF